MPQQCPIELAVPSPSLCHEITRDALAGMTLHIVGGASVYPLVWNILLAARNEGFGGTITTMAVAEEPRICQLLGIPETYAVACVLPLGKPVHQPRRLSRLDVAGLTRIEHWHGGPLTPGRI
jgi:nitroreductase